MTKTTKKKQRQNFLGAFISGASFSHDQKLTSLTQRRLEEDVSVCKNSSKLMY